MSMWKQAILAFAMLLGFAMIGEASTHMGADAKNLVLTLLFIVAPTTMCIVGALLNGERYGAGPVFPRYEDYEDDDDDLPPAPAPRPVLLAERITTTVTERLYGYADGQTSALPVVVRSQQPAALSAQQPTRALPPPAEPFVVRPAHDRPAAFVTPAQPALPEPCAPSPRSDRQFRVTGDRQLWLAESEAWLKEQ